MDLKRLKEWAGTIEGLAKFGGVLLGFAGSAWIFAEAKLQEVFPDVASHSIWWGRGGFIDVGRTGVSAYKIA